jgi:hypothetical protein
MNLVHSSNSGDDDDDDDDDDVADEMFALIFIVLTVQH